MDSYAAAWRDNLLQTLEPFKHLPILLSGGMDSATLVAALLELGARPKCYSFRLGERDSVDVRVARKICLDHALELDLTTIPRDPATLISDVRQVIRMLGVYAKAAVQCCQPIMRMCSKIAIENRMAIIGTGGICEDNRRVNVFLGQCGEDGMTRNYRRHNLLNWQASTTGRMIEMGEHCGVQLVQPYAMRPIATYGLHLDLREINWPRQKGIALRAFPEFFANGYWKKNSSLQVNSGIREWHDTLLKSKHNKRGSKAVLGVYSDIFKEVFGHD